MYMTPWHISSIGWIGDLFIFDGANQSLYAIVSWVPWPWRRHDLRMHLRWLDSMVATPMSSTSNSTWGWNPNGKVILSQSLWNKKYTTIPWSEIIKYHQISSFIPNLWTIWTPKNSPEDVRADYHGEPWRAGYVGIGRHMLYYISI